METKAKATKTTKKSTKSEEIIVKNQIDYTNILNRIFICLIILIGLLFINIVVNISTNSDSTNKNGGTEETTNGDYDVSKFKTMTTTDTISKIEAGELQVIYIGRASCGYCVKFISVLQQAQQDLGYTTTYINLEEITSAEQQKLVAYDSYVEENFGYTPMVLVFKDGKYIDGWVGYAELESFKSFLADAGVK